MNKKFFLLSDSIRTTTGNARVARELLKGLKDKGYDVANLAIGADEPEGEFEGVRMLPIRYCGFSEDEINVFLHKLSIYLDREKPNYFVVLGDRIHYGNLGIGNLSKDFLDKHNIKLIFWETVDSNSLLCMEQSFNHPTNPKYDIYKACHHIVTTAEYGKKVLEEEFVKVDRAIWEFADTDQFKPIDDEKKVELRKEYHFRKDDKIILIVGRNNRRKNHELAFEAVYPLLIKDPDLRVFAIIPEYNVRDDFNLIDYCKRILTKKHGGRDMIEEKKILFCTIDKMPLKITNGISDEEIIKFYQLSDATLSASSNEGFNLVFGETLAVGNSYIGINNTTIPELSNNGEVGFIAPWEFEFNVGHSIAIRSCKAETLRKKIKEFIDVNDDKRKELKSKNLDYVNKNLTKQKCVDTWDEYLKSIEVKE